MGCFSRYRQQYPDHLRTYDLNNVRYSREELIAYCDSQITTNPSWQNSLFGFIKFWLEGGDEIEVNTSGSTDTPKKMKLLRQHMISSAAMTAQYFGLTPGTTALHCLPTDFISGKMMCVRSLEFGWNMITVQPSSNPLANVPEQDLAFSAMTPMQAINSIEHYPEKFARIKKIILGGAPVSQQLEKKLQQFPNEIYATYGMTETMSHVAIRHLNGKRAGISYHGLPGVKFETDNRQCLVITAPHLGISKLTTNDIVTLTSPASFQFLGRADFVINSGGVKIHPEKLEYQLTHLFQAPFFITSEPDEKLGERVVLFIESEPLNDSEILRLRSTMKLYLQNHEIPKNIYFIPRFDYTSNGKLIRKNYHV